MKEIKPSSKRNPSTHKKHRREVFWQVTFPLLLGLLIILGLAVWTILATAKDGAVSQSADASLVFLILPALLMTLIPLIILIGLAYVVIILNKNIPAYMLRIQNGMLKIRDGIQAGSDKIVEPVLRIKSGIASLEVLKSKIRPK